MPFEASCPSCAAPVTFRVGASIVVRCGHCGSLVARTDRALEDLGKVAEVGDTDSPLALETKGVFEGDPFELVGRIRLSHEAGGFWDEWYASFGGERWGWLAEAEGRFFMTFPSPGVDTSGLPREASTESGSHVRLGDAGTFVIEETGLATVTAAGGELPRRVDPKATYEFVDLSGAGGRFATIDRSTDPPVVYVGREVTLAELGIDASRSPDRDAPRVPSRTLSCPNCAGSMELRAPDVSLCVTCPSCGAILDASTGALAALQSLGRKHLSPDIPLGSVGTLDGESWTVLGFLVRSVTIAKTRYFWREYLLRATGRGFAWLVESDGHWSFVRPISAGDVVEGTTECLSGGRTFKLFQHERAEVVEVHGEFYWKVRAGEAVRAMDFVSPPEILTIERTLDRKGHRGEVSYSRGTYLDRAEIAAAFGTTIDVHPVGIAPNQPYPYGKLLAVGLVLTVLSILVTMILGLAAHPSIVDDRRIPLGPRPSGAANDIVFVEDLRLSSGRNIEVEGHLDAANTWIAIDGDFYREDTGDVHPFGMVISYYFGHDSEGSWTEGRSTRRIYLSSPDTGTYTMRVELERPAGAPGTSLHLVVRQGVWHVSPLVHVMLTLWVPVGLMAIHRLVFERLRWGESKFNPYDRDDDE